MIYNLNNQSAMQNPNLDWIAFRRQNNSLSTKLEVYYLFMQFRVILIYYLFLYFLGYKPVVIRLLKFSTKECVFNK